MKVKEPEVERLLADRETPFTDFTVEEMNGHPRAVFPKLTPEQGELLSHFLYPSATYIDTIYRDALELKEGRAREFTYADEKLEATFGTRSLVIESKERPGACGAPVKVELPAVDARYLLMKWKFQCMRWDSMH